MYVLAVLLYVIVVVLLTRGMHTFLRTPTRSIFNRCLFWVFAFNLTVSAIDYVLRGANYLIGLFK